MTLVLIMDAEFLVPAQSLSKGVNVEIWFVK